MHDVYGLVISCFTEALSHTGFQHLVNIWFCSCEPEAVTLVRFEMWPATPSNPSLAFHQDLLLWMEALLLEGCIGVDAFCRALRYKLGKNISQQVKVAKNCVY